MLCPFPVRVCCGGVGWGGGGGGGSEMSFCLGGKCTRRKRVLRRSCQSHVYHCFRCFLVVVFEHSGYWDTHFNRVHWRDRPHLCKYIPGDKNAALCHAEVSEVSKTTTGKIVACLVDLLKNGYWGATIGGVRERVGYPFTPPPWIVDCGQR